MVQIQQNQHNVKLNYGLQVAEIADYKRTKRRLAIRIIKISNNEIHFIH